MCARTLFLGLLIVAWGRTEPLESEGSASRPFEVTLEVPAVIYEDQLATFNCSVEDVTVRSTTWTLDGSPLAEGGDGQLTVSVPAIWDGSCLTCHVEGTNAIVNASRILTVTDLFPTFVDFVFNQTVNENEPLLLSCSALGFPTPLVSLMMDGLAIRFSPESVTLEIQNATADHSGNYNCLAINSIGQAVSPLAVISVLYAPEIQTSPEDTTVVSGTMAILPCAARGNPTPTIHWFHNGDELIESMEEQEELMEVERLQVLDNGSLSIDMVMLSDMGSYHCTAVNELGMVESDMALVMVEVFPLFFETPSDESSMSNTSFEWTCVASGIPEPDYMWLRCVDDEDIPVQLDDRVMEVNGTLTFSTTVREDRGTYKCSAMNTLGSIISRPVELTILALPLAPEGVRVQSSGASWALVQWSADFGAEPSITTYLLEYKLSFDSNWTRLSLSFAVMGNVSSLYPNAPYQFRVIAESGLGEGPMSPVVEVMTSPGAPVAGLLDGPEQVEVNAGEVLHISWNIPQVLERTSYLHTLLTVQGPMDEEVFSNISISPVSISSQFTPATNYTISFTFVFVGEEEGAPLTLIARTADGVPINAPTGVAASVLGPQSVQVSWTPPTLPNGVITAYSIYYAPPLSNLTVGNVVTYDLDMLTPHTEYTIRVSAHTSTGEGPQGPEMGVAVTTDQDVPSAPTGVGVAVLNSTAISVTWLDFMEGEVPGILAHFTVCYGLCDLNDSHVDCLEASSDQTSVEIGDLLPYTLYCVGVAAATGAGLGAFSEDIRARTLGDVPGVGVDMLVVMEVCPTGLLVEWRLMNSDLLGGPISEVQYVLTYTRVDGVVDMQYFAYSPGLTRYVVEGVIANTVYHVEMALQNLNGTGMFSESVSITTCDAAAPPPDSIVALSGNSTSIVVTWDTPPDVPGELQGFVVRYRVVEEQYMLANVSRNQYVIDGLEPYTIYFVGVASQTRGPLGNFSEDMSVLTLGDVPEVAVVGVSVQPMCPSDLLVEWSSLSPQQLRAAADDAIYLVVVHNNNVLIANITTPSSRTTALVTELDIDTEYSVTVVVANVHGIGPSSDPVLNRTLEEGAPSPPTDVMVMALNSSTLEVMWPSSSTSSNYTVHYYPTADLSLLEVWHVVTAPPPHDGFYVVLLNDLEIFTNYSIEVSATTICGTDESDVVIGTTAEAPPTSPTNVGVAATLPTKVKVQWSIPASANGIIIHYNVYCPNGNVSVPARFLSYECCDLEPESNYSIAVSAVNGGGEGPVISVSATTTCSPAIPIAQIGEGGVVTVSLQGPCSTSTMYILVVVQELLSYANHTYQLPTQTIDTYDLEELQEFTEEYKGRVNRRGRREALNEGGGVYIAANLTQEELDNGFVLGDSMMYGSFVNYALVPQVFYNLNLRAAVSGTDTPLFFSSETPLVVDSVGTTDPPPGNTDPPPGNTDPPPGTTKPLPTFPLVPVVAGSAGLVLVGICMAAVLSCICCCCNRSLDKVDGVTGLRIERTGSFRLSKRKLTDPVDEFRASTRTEALEDHAPVPVMGFINKLMVMRTNDNQLFLEEFGSIPMTMPHLPADTANLHSNKPKNRYNNILPYDITRVKLKGHDYINANYCSGYRKTKAYIATQGPLQETIGDFWQMVWDENVRTIVMLTNTQEKGKIKCEVYWPREVGASTQHGHLDVSLASVTTLADYSIRTFAVHKVGSSKEAREVIQFHFTSWPDHGVPQYATAMLALLRRVRAHYSMEEGPMLVHCSAGVGRTGTFIVIDTMLQRLVHEEDTLDIYGHVTLLRSQRNYMIQTEDQYFFVHEAIAEALLCGNTEVKLDSLPGYVEGLYSVIPDDESETTNVELQFKRLALERNDPHRWTTANKDANKTKNRFVNVLPYDSSRVSLEYKPGVDGSDYINASHVDSYHTRRAFIATQGPLSSTVQDFWRMLWQYSVPVVVMLTEEVEKGRECSAGYWPGAILQPINYGAVNVELNVERNSGSYTYRDLCVTNIKENQKRLVRQFQFHCWPEVGVPTPTVLIEFIREVQKLCRSLPSPHGPIVVHCSNGVGRTGVFLSLHIILERMLVEGLIDVFQTVKNLRIQRPAMVQTLEQYHFCYDCAITFLQSSEFLPLHPPPPLLTRQRGSSQRGSSQRGSSHQGSRHGSHSSIDSRKKSKNPSPSRSPTRSASLRNTPMRSESLKEPAKELDSTVATSVGTAQVYGDNDTTSTFGSHLTPPTTMYLVPADSAISHSQPVLAGGCSPAPTHPSSQPGGYPTFSSVENHLQHDGPQGASNQFYTATVTNNTSRTSDSQSLAGLYGSHTPVMAGSHTPLMAAPVMAGSHTPVMAGSHTPVMAASVVTGSHTPVMATPVTAGPMMAGSHTPVIGASGVGSQSSVYSGSLFTGSQTPPMMSYESLIANNSQSTPQGHMNNHYHHQLLESQRHTPNSLPEF